MKKMYGTLKKKSACIDILLKIFHPFSIIKAFELFHKYLIFWYCCHAERIIDTGIWIFMIYWYAFWKKKKDASKCYRKFYESLCFLFLFLYFFTLRRIQIQWGTRCDRRQANHQQGTGDDFRIRSENCRNSARQRKSSFSCATHVVETVILWKNWIFPIWKYDFRCQNN